MKTTRYFREQVVLRKRPYIQMEWCKRILAEPIARAVQSDGRIRFWGRVPEFGGRVLRVVTLTDGETGIMHFPTGISRLHRRKESIMKLHYDQETDSLYIDLNSRPSADSREIQEGVVIDGRQRKDCRHRHSARLGGFGPDNIRGRFFARGRAAPKLTVARVAGLVLMCAAPFGQSGPRVTQSQTFHVRGTITDPLEAVIPRVEVTFQSEQIRETVSTNNVGVYEADLPLGVYTMTAQNPGFRPYRRPLFRVMTPASLTFNINLPAEKQVNRVVVNRSGSRVTREEWAAALEHPDYYGEESFPASSEDGVPFQLYIRYTRRATAANGAYIYTHDMTPYEDPVVVAYNLFSLQADEVVYDVKTRTIKSSGNVIVVDESGATQRADSMSFKIENGRATLLQ